MYNKNHNLVLKFGSLQKKIYGEIESLKQTYHASLSFKLKDLNTAPKAYWFIVKTCMIKTKPCIPPILKNERNKFMVEFKQNAEIFDSFFSNQCAATGNNTVTVNFP